MASPPESLRHALTEYRGVIEATLPGRVLRVTLFGSMARGEAHEDSDVDLLVLIASPAFAERREVIDCATRVGLSHDFVFSPVVLSDGEWQELISRERLLPQEIARDGIEV